MNWKLEENFPESGFKVDYTDTERFPGILLSKFNKNKN